MSVTTTLSKFSELAQWADAFTKTKGLKLMFLVGNPGTAKSRSFKDRLEPNQHRYIKCGRLTAFQLYKQLYKFKDQAIILDDVEDAMKRPDTARILMNLCETDEEARTVAWFGSESLLKVTRGEMWVDIPQKFKTNSRVCLICNDWDILLSKFQALLDRGTVVFFDPPPEEIHTVVGSWFKDEEIYAFIGQHLDEIPQHSIRFYVIAQELKANYLDWEQVLLESWQNEHIEIDPEKVVEMLLADPRYQSDKERIEAFTAKSGRLRRQWYNLKKKVLRRKPGLGYLPQPQPPVDNGLDQFEPEKLP